MRELQPLFDALLILGGMVGTGTVLAILFR
jgi:hypothetical protein